MPSYPSHIHQTNRNLVFLSGITKNEPDHFDWHVTVAFYAAVHAVNAHLAKFGDHFRTHTKVIQSINYQAGLPTSVDEKCYIAYKKLRNLSRRSRYLVKDADDDEQIAPGDEEKEFVTFCKHAAKAIRNLDELLKYFGTIYGAPSFNKVAVVCAELSSSEPLKFFTVVQQPKS